MQHIDFGELKNDTNLVSRVENVQQSLDSINQHVDKMLQLKYDDLTPEDKVEYDIFMVYAINSLYFMHLKIIGDNSQTTDVKHELSRVKQIMSRQKEVEDRHLRPLVETAAAKRFVKSALYDVQQKNEQFRRGSKNRTWTRDDNSMQQSTGRIHIGANPNPVNRKRKFDDD